MSDLSGISITILILGGIYLLILGLLLPHYVYRIHLDIRAIKKELCNQHKSPNPLLKGLGKAPDKLDEIEASHKAKKQTNKDVDWDDFERRYQELQKLRGDYEPPTK
jgi:preprotein translocase subunit Sec63